MKTRLSVLVLFGNLIFLIFGCTGTLKRSETSERIDTSALHSSPQLVNAHKDTLHQLDRMTDFRDGETYAIVTIGHQTWMAENLRYNAPGSWLNPNYPSPVYGRLYDPASAQSVCPEGWHLPSDSEWNVLEMTLGMPAADTSEIGWRGTHGKHMKSKSGWKDCKNGTNNSGFNAVPSGYSDSDEFGGLGRSVGFWASAEDSIVWMRWLGAPLEGVNRQPEYDISSGWGAACRCIKD